MRAIEERVRLNRHLALQCSQCDVVTIHCPLHDGTKGLFNKELIGKMKKGAYLVRPAICLPCVCLSFPFSSFPALSAQLLLPAQLSILAVFLTSRMPRNPYSPASIHNTSSPASTCQVNCARGAICDTEAVREVGAIYPGKPP